MGRPRRRCPFCSPPLFQEWAAGPKKGHGTKWQLLITPSSAIFSDIHSTFLVFSLISSLILSLKFMGPTVLQPKARTSLLSPLFTFSRSLSYSFLYIGDLAVTIHWAGGPYCWTEFLKCEFNGALFLYSKISPSPLSFSSPNSPHLLLPLIQPQLSANYLNWLWIHSDTLRYSINFIFLEMSSRAFLPTPIWTDSPLHPGYRGDPGTSPHHPGRFLLSLCQTICFLDPMWPFGLVHSLPLVFQDFPDKVYMRDKYFRLCMLKISLFCLLT